MRIKHKIKAKRAWSRMDREAIKSAVAYCHDIYDLPNWGTVVVKLCAHKDEHGSCINLDDENFVIQISKYSTIEEAIKTVFHEFWHVRQYLFEGLKLEGGSAMFRNTFYDIDVSNCNHEEYEASLWEVEARAAEVTTWKLYTK